MKKYFALTILLVAALALSACGMLSPGQPVSQPTTAPSVAQPAMEQPPVPTISVVEELPSVKSQPQPVAPATTEAPKANANPQEWVCDVQLVGDALVTETSTALQVKVPAGYKYLIASMDPAVLKVAGKDTPTVYGALVLSDGDFTIVTVKANSQGLGWNGNNKRFNVHVCAIPSDVDPVALLKDWQFGQPNSGSAGEHKPVGVVIKAKTLSFAWTTPEFTAAQFDELFNVK